MEKSTYQHPRTEVSPLLPQSVFMGSGNTGEDYKPVPLELGNGLDQFPNLF